MLKDARDKIDKIDRAMLELFEERMKCVEEVIAYKMENGIQIFDENREKSVIEKNLKNLKDKKYEKYYIEFIQNLMDLSKSYQQEKLNK